MANKERANRTDRTSRRVLSRRQVLQALGASGVITSLAGCSGGGQEATTTPTPASDEDGATPTATQTETTPTLQDSVTIALDQNPTRGFWTNLYGVMPYFTRVLEPLVWAGDKLEAVPWLAESWEATGDRTWEFTLREDVTFHNGKPLTADAVVFSIGEIFDGFGNAKPFLQLEGPDSVRKVDTRTVEFTTIEPFATYPAHIAHNMVAVQHPDADEKANKPIATGPFQLEEIEPDQFARVSVFEDYWRDEEPNVSEITFRVIGDPNTRALALEGHNVDVAYNPPSSKVASMRDSDEMNVLAQERPETTLAGINIYKSPTDDRRLRRALNYAVAQQVLVETVLENIGSPAKGPIPPSIYWSVHEDLPSYGPDRQQAKQLVEESDYAGETLELTVSSGKVNGKTVAETLQQWFSDIGVDTQVKVLEKGTAIDRWYTGKTHLRLQDPGTFSAAADLFLFALFHSEGNQNWQRHQKEGTGVMNPGDEVDQLIDEGRSTLDREVKIEKYSQVQQIIMDLAVVIPLYYHEYVVGTYRDVSDVHTPPISQMVRWASLKHHKP